MSSLTATSPTTALAPESATGVQTPPQATDRESLILSWLDAVIAPLGYEVVHVELQMSRQKILRVFIDLTDPPSGKSVGIEDCVNVTRALDLLMEPASGEKPLEFQKIDQFFGGQDFELEVSSPGVERPLRLTKDYKRFQGETVRIHTFRPLTSEEMGNEDYWKKNSKQKNFKGELLGLEGASVRLREETSAQTSRKRKKKSSEVLDAQGVTTILIPLVLVAKAHLEPNLEEWMRQSAKSSGDEK